MFTHSKQHALHQSIYTFSRAYYNIARTWKRVWYKQWENSHAKAQQNCIVRIARWRWCYLASKTQCCCTQCNLIAGCTWWGKTLRSLEVTKFAATAHTDFAPWWGLLNSLALLLFFLQDEAGYRHNIIAALFFILAVPTLYDSSISSHSLKYKLQGFTQQ